MSEETKKPIRVYLHPKECEHGFYDCGLCHDKAGDLMTDADRLAALESEVARLKQEVASLQRSRIASQAFGPINPIPKIGPGSKWEPPEVRPVELDPQLVKELREAAAKFCKDRKEVDGE